MNTNILKSKPDGGRFITRVAFDTKPPKFRRMSPGGNRDVIKTNNEAKDVQSAEYNTAPTALTYTHHHDQHGQEHHRQHGGGVTQLLLQISNTSAPPAAAPAASSPCSKQLLQRLLQGFQGSHLTSFFSEQRKNSRLWAPTTVAATPKTPIRHPPAKEPATGPSDKTSTRQSASHRTFRGPHSIHGCCSRDGQSP